jgi:hypothetical protein
MKFFLLVITAFAFFVLPSTGSQKNFALGVTENVSVAKSQKDSSDGKQFPPVLIELFTSEGCVTCPPSDRVLAELEKTQPNPDAEIITLAMHVDYWNTVAWKDRFSSALYSQRQEIYGRKFKLPTVYTPQMIVDGTKQFIGNNLNEANKMISESARSPKAKIEIILEQDNLKLQISDVPKHTDATVFLAFAENNLSTKVGGGENRGRTLEHHSVVRELKPLGRIPATDSNFQIETKLQFHPDWKRENLKVIVFIQENLNRKILGVDRINLDK